MEKPRLFKFGSFHLIVVLLLQVSISSGQQPIFNTGSNNGGLLSNLANIRTGGGGNGLFGNGQNTGNPGNGPYNSNGNNGQYRNGPYNPHNNNGNQGNGQFRNNWPNNNGNQGNWQFRNGQNDNNGQFRNDNFGGKDPGQRGFGNSNNNNNNNNRGNNWRF